MSDLEQVDVITTSEDDVKATVLSKCAYCDCQKDGVLVFHCEKCSRWIHASCLHSGSPSSVLGDNYFNFRCVSCTEDGKETFERMKLTWGQVVMLALYNLSQTSLGKQGYFKWKEDICVFIDNHWDVLFGNNKKKNPQWSCSVCSTLSAGNPHRFQSGYGVFKDAGWWRLADPTHAPEYCPGAPSLSTPRAKPKKTYFGSSSRSSLRKRVHCPSPRPSSADAKQRKTANKESAAEDVGTANSPASSGTNPDGISAPSSPASSLSSSDAKISIKKETKIDPTLPLVALSDDSDAEELMGDCIKRESFELSNLEQGPVPQQRIVAEIPFTLPANKEKVSQTIDAVDESDTAPKVKPLSLYDERKLLKKLLTIPGVEANLEGRRLRRKLLLRQKKRELGLPVFNFDSLVRRLHAKEQGLPIPHDELSLPTRKSSALSIGPTIYSRHHRILDRFLSSDRKCVDGNDGGRTFRQKLVGCDQNSSSNNQLIVSPHTQRVLKPYIRRDMETIPPKLKLLREIISHAHRHNTEMISEPSAPIDFCYVRPAQIPTINSMCRHFFWPGVDLSESLQYPDFSVVALYKKLVIGFGFLVPDVAFNEAYVSFLLVHPDWQKAGIGTFMLYHLMQTCMGKDVTLHVSASNPAMLLYQRFGFKPERFDADFYDKYQSPDSNECSHAFFMRLSR
uniref:Cysteine-rich protein 2-binding protein n=1 Tax=Phallusia mammillata TaxID=59560 RepID=A0A6F9D9H3_9ASCI|nr:cysteine-rich protein 2-binding protein [Phallusia mammillata]